MYGVTHTTQMEDKSNDFQRITLIDKITVLYPQFNKIIMKIAECHEKVKLVENPPSLLITGEVGAGKTIIFEHYLQQTYKTWEEENEHGIQVKKNILPITLTSALTPGGLIVKLLTELGAPNPGYGKNESEKLERLFKFLHDCGVELIMFDEFHNMIDRDKKKTLVRVAEVIKDIINNCKVAFILFGLHDPENKALDSRVILQQSSQLSKRVSESHHIKRFPFSTAKDKRDFCRLLQEINKLLPFEESSNLEQPEIAEMIYEATKGLIYSVKKLIDAAAVYAIKKQRKCISINDLSKAFETNEFISRDAFGHKLTNPFKFIVDDAKA